MNNFYKDNDELSFISEEPIQEQRIVTSTEYNMIIEINPTENYPNFLLDPYFKLYYSSKYRANEGKCSRISMLRPELINHHGSIMKINSKEVSFLIALLKSNHDNQCTNWQYMCNYVTDRAKEKGYKVDYRNNEMPEYELLKGR